MSADSLLIEVKGFRDGLLVTLGEASWLALESALIQHIDEHTNFFQGARLALDVGTQVLKVAELVSLRDKLSERGISLWAVLSESPLTETTAQNLGLATRLSRQQPPAKETVSAEMPEDWAKWIRGPLRSGGRVEFAGNVVVMGDVNPGAEIVAGGSIVVWGRLRGVVHAGAAGDETAVVCALEFAPSQLRLAGEIAVSPPKKDRKPRPEIARLKDGHLMVEAWQP